MVYDSFFFIHLPKQSPWEGTGQDSQNVKEFPFSSLFHDFNYLGELEGDRVE